MRYAPGMAVEKWSDDVRVAHLGDDPQFADDLEQLNALAEGGGFDAVLDFANVSFIGSSNIAEMLRLKKTLGGKDRRVICAGMDPAIRSTLQVTGVDQMFVHVDNVPMALAAVTMT